MLNFCFEKCIFEQKFVKICQNKPLSGPRRKAPRPERGAWGKRLSTFKALSSKPISNSEKVNFCASKISNCKDLLAYCCELLIEIFWLNYALEAIWTNFRGQSLKIDHWFISIQSVIIEHYEDVDWHSLMLLPHGALMVWGTVVHADVKLTKCYIKVEMVSTRLKNSRLIATIPRQSCSCRCSNTCKD